MKGITMSKLAVVMAAWLTCTASLAENKVLTVNQSLQALSALRALDGRDVIAKKDGQETIIRQPWEFQSGPLRLAIATDISLLTQIEQQSERARVDIINSVSKGAGRVEPNTPEYAQFLKQWTEVIDAPAPISGSLTRIKAKDLRLDVNEIPGSTLSALVPILDQ